MPLSPTDGGTATCVDHDKARSQLHQVHAVRIRLGISDERSVLLVHDASGQTTTGARGVRARAIAAPLERLKGVPMPRLLLHLGRIVLRARSGLENTVRIPLPFIHLSSNSLLIGVFLLLLGPGWLENGAVSRRDAFRTGAARRGTRLRRCP